MMILGPEVEMPPSAAELCHLAATVMVTAPVQGQDLFLSQGHAPGQGHYLAQGHLQDLGPVGHDLGAGQDPHQGVDRDLDHGQEATRLVVLAQDPIVGPDLAAGVLLDQFLPCPLLGQDLLDPLVREVITVVGEVPLPPRLVLDQGTIVTSLSGYSIHIHICT